MKPAFLIAVAVFGGIPIACLGATITLPAAGAIVSLDQCESQTCGISPFVVGYNGPLSGYSGSSVVGEGANLTISGTPLPSVSAVVPLAGANAIDNGELTYFIAVVPLDGDSSVVPVQIGVNGAGMMTASTAGGLGGQSDDNTLVQFALLSDSSGDAVFSDSARIDYVTGEDNQGNCINTTNNSTVTGAGFVSTPGVNGAMITCGASYMYGGFNETGSYSISSNSIYEVVLNETLSIGILNNGTATAGGTVQGSASIDPMFTAPAGFQIELSPGIGNTLPSTPEPATWTTLAAALVLCSRRFRQR